MQSSLLSYSKAWLHASRGLQRVDYQLQPLVSSWRPHLCCILATCSGEAAYRLTNVCDRHVSPASLRPEKVPYFLLQPVRVSCGLCKYDVRPIWGCCELGVSFTWIDGIPMSHIRPIGGAAGVVLPSYSHHVDEENFLLLICCMTKFYGNHCVWPHNRCTSRHTCVYKYVNVFGQICTGGCAELLKQTDFAEPATNTPNQPTPASI